MDVNKSYSRNMSMNNKWILLKGAIKQINPFAIIKEHGDNETYFFFSLSGGYITEIWKQELSEMDMFEILSKAKEILNNYYY